jgi:hypothetical protein
MQMSVNAGRLLLLATTVAGVACGVVLREHWHKILASVLFGIGVGLAWRHSWRQVRQQSPAVVDQAQRNAADAQEMLRESFAWKLGARRPMAALSLAPEEVLSEGISIVLTVCLAAMVWVLPVFWAPSEGGLVALGKAAGAHFFALCCIAAATFGGLTRIAGKQGGAL